MDIIVAGLILGGFASVGGSKMSKGEELVGYGSSKRGETRTKGRENRVGMSEGMHGG